MPELNLVLLGPPGSGKGTQGERLNADLHLPYYATGDILRAAVRDETDLGKSAKEYMDRGDLVPDEVIVGVIVEALGSEGGADGRLRRRGRAPARCPPHLRGRGPRLPRRVQPAQGRGRLRRRRLGADR